MNNELRIANTLKELGIPASLSGYKYLICSIEKVMISPELAHNICKGLYPEVAKVFNKTTSSIERAIRHAIERGILRANMELVDKIFRYSYSQDKGKPTNSEFIATLADWLSMNSEE